jgi:hypothetical protein
MPSGADERRRAALEVRQVLAQRVQVEVRVLVGGVVLVVPVVGEDAAVDVAQDRGTPAAGLDDVLDRVEPAVLALLAGEEAVRPVVDVGALGVDEPGEEPALVACGRGDGVPDLLGGRGQLDLAADLELTGHLGAPCR